MGRPPSPLHPRTQLFSSQLATRLLVVTGVASLALPAACGGGTATVTTTGTSTSNSTARGSGGAANTAGMGGMPTASSTTDGLIFEAGIPADASGPLPTGPDCFDWPLDAGSCPTDPNAVIFEFDKAGCVDAGGGFNYEPYLINSGPTMNASNQCCYMVQFYYCITGGRPYLVATEARVASAQRDRRGDPDPWSPAATPGGLGDLTAAERSALAAAWTADALLEHASVASFSRFALALLAVGAPAELVLLTHRAALDEVRHAELCFALASAYAGESVGPGPFPVGARVDAGGSLASLAASTVREGCIGETVAAVVAAEQLARATDPAVRAALARIADDEARHAELAWRTVAWAMEAGGCEVRQAVAQAFGAALGPIEALPMGALPPSPTRAEAPVTDQAPVPAALAAHGRLSAVATAGAVAAAMAKVVAPSARALLQHRPLTRVARAEGLVSAAFRAKYGPWALVAGASEGIGAAFAEELAARGLHLVLLARRLEPLEKLAQEIRARHGVEVRTASVDLGAPTLLEDVRRASADLEVGLLVYNAAVSLIGPFLDQSLADKLRLVDVNCRGPLVLSDELGRAMVRRGRGGIVLMSSLAGTQGTAYVATYAATKAFNLVLGEGLWDELRDHGVDVLACRAGATRTPAYVSSNPAPGPAPVMEARPVAVSALDALGKGPSMVPGVLNGAVAFLMQRLMPRRAAVATMGKATRKMYR